MSISKEAKREYDKKYYQNNKEDKDHKNRQYAIAHKEELNSYSRKYKKENPQRRAKYVFKYSLKKYGLTEEDYRIKVLSQNNLCAICYRRMNRPYIDHDHTTGRTRDLLCICCNTLLGMSFENLKILKSAIEYLKRHSG